MKRRFGAVFCFLILLVSSTGLAQLPSNTLCQCPPSFSGLAEKVKDPVVNISTTEVVKSPLQNFLGPNSPFKEFFGDDMLKRFFGEMPQGGVKTHALGSGFVIDQTGLILTNNHLVEKASKIKIKLASGKEYDAKVIGSDSKTDLALIKVLNPDADLPKPARLGDSSKMLVGDLVMAVGNPFALGHTVTVGIISATGRVIGAGPYDDFLQTDAAINPGNSGGPLFNLKGEVIGINTAIVAQAQGIGFAIPVNMANEILPQLKQGKVIRGWLGIMIQDVTPDLAKSFGLKEAKGALVADVVPNSPAEKGGLKRGDIIVGYQGKDVDNAHTLSRLAAMTAPNTKVSMAIIRDQKRISVPVVIGSTPTKKETPAAPAPKPTAWGMTVQDLTPQLAQQLGMKPGESGVIVTDIDQDSPAADSGIQPGDVIKEINHQPVNNMADYNRIVSKTNVNQNLLVLIRRGDTSAFITIQPPAEEENNTNQ